MKTILFLAGLLLASPCYAFECPTIQSTTPNVNFTTTDHFKKLAETMDVSCLASYNEISPLSTRFDFVAPGDTAQSWSHMLTVTLIDTEKADAGNALKALSDKFIDRIKELKGKTQILAMTDTQNSSPTQRGIWYTIGYALGEGDTFENSVLILRSVGPRRIAMLQYQQRGEETLATETIKRFMAANGLSLQP